MNMKKTFLFVLACSVLLSACQTTKERVLDVGDQTQLQKRSYQSRVFETGDKDTVLRGVISTLQDLGFVINKADYTLGTVSATKLDRNQIKVTVMTRPKGKDRMTVRANAQYNTSPIEDPVHYQNFFSSLEKALFLTAQLGE